MIKRLFLSAVLLVMALHIAGATNPEKKSNTRIQSKQDASRLAELDKFWADLSKAIKEGDFESYE